MKTNIWIMNHYAGSMYFNRGGRHYNFAKYLRRAGYEPVIFGAISKHGSAECFFETDALWEERIAEEIDTPFIFVRARTYTGNGKQRVLNMIDFYRNVKKAAKEYAAQHGKPNVIYASSVHPLTLVAGLQLAKHFGVKCVCEVRDLWPESIVVEGVAGPYNPAVIALRILERWIYKSADSLIFTMESAYDYIEEHHWEKDVPMSKVFYVNNGVDLETYDRNRTEKTIEDPDLTDPNVFKVVYAGSMRPSNSPEMILDCAEKLRAYPKICFLMYGGGELLEDIRQACEERGLSNCKIKGPVSKEYIPYILSCSDLNLLNYPLKAGDLYKYGSSQNKLFEYMASGKPILSNVAMKNDIVLRYGCGVSRAMETSEEYAEEILKMYRLPKEEYVQMCRNGRQAARDYDFPALTKKLLAAIGG